MRKVILQEFISLDGLAAGPNGSVDFIPASTAGDRRFGRGQLALMEAIDTILLGRVTYQMFAGYWPNVTEGEEKPFADKINLIPKIVFSRTLDRAPWGIWNDATVVRKSPLEEVRRLKGQPGRDMVVWGSLSLAQSLINDRLIDEYRLVLCPVVLGRGRPLFDEKVAPLDVKLIDATSQDLGAVSLRYVQRNGGTRGQQARV